MKVNNIVINNFRNFEYLTLEPESVINVFLGANAQGKTNLLESIHFASLGRSHRAPKESDVIQWNKPQAIINLTFQKLGVEQSVAFELSTDKPRRILLNSQPIKIKQLVGRFNTVLFAPEDLFLIKGSPANRRKFLDAEISQASPVYFADILTYNRILTQRNTLLKLIKEGREKPSSLNLWNEQLAASAVRIISKRLESIQKINLIANSVQNKISAQLENLSIIYETHGAKNNEVLNYDTDMWYYNKLIEHQDIDIARGSSSFGPHLDDIKFLINDYDIRSFGSQGQQRTAILALKLSELEFLKVETGDYPILLLDDVMSELDVDRRSRLLDFLNGQQIQTFITATDAAYFPKNSNAKFYIISNGKLDNFN
ncbi:MAG: DNA replication/repair protein RecF [Selenomonadaceae bacterium]|nr:DNA replication/repair protein RecF [Selenomonadaceae bacterium]MBR1859676.1 DNA replication/repair protein RecF [Selenomonadaceae bacterium]